MRSSDCRCPRLLSRSWAAADPAKRPGAAITAAMTNVDSFDTCISLLPSHLGQNACRYRVSRLLRQRRGLSQWKRRLTSRAMVQEEIAVRKRFRARIAADRKIRSAMKPAAIKAAREKTAVYAERRTVRSQAGIAAIWV